jgi:hypothetical protein
MTIKYLAMAPILMLAAGCVMPFSGERNLACKVNILGNTVEWNSAVAGSYAAVQTESGVAK